MIFCKKCEYAIRALVHLARSGQTCGVREISQNQRIPYSFASKVFQELKAQGFLQSARGVGGGFSLARPAEQIRLVEVVEQLGCAHFLSACLYGFSGCSDSNPCPMHEAWKPIRNQIEVYLQTHTIGDLIRFPEEADPRLAARGEWPLISG